MIKKVFNWSFGAFFRTIGRILAYLCIGFLLAIVCSKLGLNLGYIQVNAATIDVTDSKFNLYTAITRDNCNLATSYGYKKFNSSTDITDKRYINKVHYLISANFQANQSYTLTLIQSYNPKASVLQTINTLIYRMEAGTTDSNLSANNISSFKCFATNDKTNNFRIILTCNFVPLSDIKKLWLEQLHPNCGTTANYFNTYTLKINSNSSTEESINNQTEVIIDKSDKIIEGQDKINDSITSDSDDDESSKCGIICKLKTIVKFLKPTSLSNLIIPNENQMHDLMDTMQTQVTSKLGILGFPITLYTQMIDLVQNVSDTNWCIDWPDVSVPNFEDHNIIAAGQFCFSSILQNEKINAFRVSCHLIIGALILLAFVQFLKNCYNRVLDLPDREEYTYFTTEDVYSVSANGETELKQVRNRSTYREKR